MKKFFRRKDLEVIENKEKINNTESNIKNLSEGSYQWYISKDRNYEIKNVGEDTIIIDNTSNYYSRYDVVKKDIDNQVKSFENYIYGDIELEAGERVRLSNKYVDFIRFWLPNEFVGTEVEIKEIEEEALYKFTVTADKNYEIKNIGINDIIIQNFSDYYKRYEIVHYNVDGTTKLLNKEAYDYIELLNGESAIIANKNLEEIDFCFRKVHL